MVTANIDYKEFKSLYYKTNIVKDEFLELLNMHLCDQGEYECKTTVHSAGLSFERTKRSLSGLFSCKTELIFSQRNNFAVMSVKYSIPVITKYYRFFLGFGFLCLTMLKFDISVLRLINIILILVLSMIDIISYMIYKIGSRDINAFISRSLGLSERISYNEYQNLIGED